MTAMTMPTAEDRVAVETAASELRVKADGLAEESAVAELFGEMAGELDRLAGELGGLEGDLLAAA